MVDVSGKPATARTARASGRVAMKAGTLRLIAENRLAKGDVLAVAKLAGIMAAKNTAGIIPLCHPIRLTDIDLKFRLESDRPSIRVESTVKCADRTGAEMEALAAVAAACLTIYDMAKAVDRGMVISDIMLLEKSGGRSGHWRRDPTLNPSPARRGK